MKQFHEFYIKNGVIRLNEKIWLSAEEAASKLGLSVGHVRELCVIGLKDKENGIVAQKVGKSWRILPNEINRKLGRAKDDESYQKDLYIKELENKVKAYEMKISTLKSLVGTIGSLVEQ